MDGFGRFFFSNIPRISENWENCRKITDEFRDFLFFLLRFLFSRQRHDALQILVGRGTSTNCASENVNHHWKSQL